MNEFRPYLFFNKNSEEALKLYKECFGGEISEVNRVSDTPMKDKMPQELQNKLCMLALKVGQ